jgi:hypothetical protein
MTWPICIALAIIIVCLAFMLIFRKEIQSLLNRTKTVKYGGGEIQTENPSQEPINATASSTDAIMKKFDNPLLREQEEIINENLKKDGILQADKEKVLIRYLALTHFELSFLRIESAIWGSQIYILEELNDRRTSGSSKESIKINHYDDAVKKWPERFVGYTFDMYLDFLKSSNLVLERDGNLYITNLGVEFLQYLAKIGRSGARFRPG